jgi:TP901 family phage tail tape measure protein
MSEVNANIAVHIDTSAALAQLKSLQRQIATFHSQISKSSATAAMAQKNLQTNLLNAVNATGKFHAQMGVIRTSTESFTNSLETNKFSMREYFRYAGGASKGFGKLFKSEFDTIGKVAEDRVKKMQTQYIKMGRDASGAMRAMSITPNTLNMQDYSTKTALAAQKQAIFNQLVRQGSTSLLNFGKNTQWAGRQLMVGFSVPLLYIGGAAAKVFMDLEQQAVKFKRVYGDMFTTSDQTNKALQEVQLLAKEFTKYGVSVSKTMEMAASAAAMGKTGSELTAQVAQATRLAVLGSVEQEQALLTTISLTNAFGVAATDLAKDIDFLNSVENQTVVSIEDLTIAIPKAGPVVKQLGGDVKDLAFFLTAMKEGGINASEGANALKSGLASLINPSKKASEMLAGFGINIKNIVDSNQGNIKDTVIEFAQALDTLAPLDRSRAIEQMFGKFQFARLSTLFQNITKEGTQANRVLELSKMEIEELAILSERELKTVENAVGTNFKEAMESLKLTIAPIGESFLEAVTPIVKSIAGLLEKFNGLGDGTKRFIVIASTLVGIIGPTLLMAFGLVANGAANIIKLFLALRVGFLKLGGNSKILAEQTNYMNSEQMEAATVAASLNQAHTRLTQSFTAETSAVRLLRQAYIDATVAAANFARANPGMMRPGKGGTAPKKFADGSTYVPGSGNKDTVASMLTPGEAVIPRDIAQNPRFQPIIDAMVSGKLQGFNDGTNKVTQAAKAQSGSASTYEKNLSDKRVTFEEQQYNAKTAAGAKNTQKYLDNFQEVKQDSPYYNASKGGKQYVYKHPTGDFVRVGDNPSNAVRVFDYKTISEGLSKYSTKQSLTASTLDKNIFHLLGSNVGKQRSGPFGDLNKQIKEQGSFTSEINAVRDRLNKEGISISSAQEKNLSSIQASHLKKSLDSKGVKLWDPRNISSEPGAVNNYMNRVEKGFGQKILNDPKLLKELSIDRQELQNLIDGKHPKNIAAAETLQKVAQYDLRKNPKDVQAIAVDETMKHRLGADFYKRGVFKTLAERFPNSSKVKKEMLKAEAAKAGVPLDPSSSKKLISPQEVKQIKKRLSARSLKELIRIDADVRSSSMAKVKPTDFGRQIKPSVGYSFPVPGIGGEYEKNGVRKFVKPMIDEKSALAELRANKIARDVHGLETPAQVMKTMADPNNKNRKIIVLESSFDPRFAESNMTGKFTKDQYFRQLTASLLRGDKDLKRGNLSGNILTDPGASGVFDKASGRRDFSPGMKSLLGQAEINLLGVPGGRGLSKDFAKATVDIPKGMSADQYHKSMIAEIDRTLPLLKKTVKEFGLTNPSEKAAYEDMIKRLEKGKLTDWRGIHKMHSSVLVTKDEMLEDKKGKTSAIKKTKATRAVAPIVPNKADRYMAAIPKGKQVVQGPLRLRGRADAPLSQADQIKQRAGQEGVSLSTARRRLVIENKLIQGMQKQSSVVKTSTEGINENTKATKSSKESIRAFGTKASIGVGAISGLTIAASFAGGKVGEMAQKIMPFVFGLQGVLALFPLLMNPLIGIPIALAAVAVGIYLFKKKQDDAIKAQARLVDQLYATTTKMQQVGEISGNVGASQVAARKRENVTGDFSVERKGIKFGSAFLQSEVGKADIAAFETRFKAMPDIAMREFSLKLASYVSDGVIDAAQAASIADQIGIQFQDKVIGIKLQGQLQKLLTVDGKDLATEPFEIRIKIAEETVGQFINVMPNLEKELSVAEDILKVAKEKASLAMTDYASRKITDEQFDGIIGTLRAAEKRVKDIEASLGKFNAFAGALASQSFESIQAQIDAIDVSTSKSIDKLKADKAATKDLAKQALIQTEIDRLETKRFNSTKKLRNMNDQVLNVIEKQLKLATSGEKNQFFLASSEAIKTRFKGTKQETDANVFLDKSRAMGETSLRANIEAVVSSGQLGSRQATGLLNLFGDDKKGLSKTFNTYLTVQGLEDLNRLQSIVGGFEDQTLAKTIMINMSGLSDAEFQAQYSTLELLTQLDNEEINIEIVLKDPGALAKITSINTAIENIPNVTQKSVELVLAQVGFSSGGLKEISANWEYFAGLPSDLRKTALQTFTTLHATIFANKESKMEWARNYAESITPNLRKQNREEAVTRVLTTIIDVKTGGFTEKGSKAISADVLAQTKDIIGLQKMMDALLNPKSSASSAGGKSRDTTLDDLLNKLKRTRDASINAQGGMKELLRLLEGKKDIKIFKGLDQQLAELGANDSFINFIGGMDKAIEKSYLNVKELAKGLVKLTPLGDAALKGYNEGVVGDFQNASMQAIAGLRAQRAEFTTLTLATGSATEAAEMLADANFAVALSSAKTAGEVKILIDALRLQKKEAELTAEAMDPIAFLKGKVSEAANKMNNFFSLMNQDIEGRFARQILVAERAVDTAQKNVEKAQEEVVKIQDTIEGIQSAIDKKQREIEEKVTRPIEEFQKSIDDIEETINTNFDKPISVLQDESSKLSNDLTLLDKIAEAINKKYDAQEEALSKIADINKDLIAQEKQKISLADALTQGDISAAAQAVQDMRQASTDSASRGAGDIVKAAREAELEKLKTAQGLTRLQIEERQFQISQDIYNLELDRKTFEQQIATIKETKILPLEREREEILLKIRGYEDEIYNTTIGSLKTAQDTLAKQVELLDQEKAKLLVIQDARQKELDHLDDLKLQWTEVERQIAAAELATIDFQGELITAIGLAKQLAAALALKPQFSNSFVDESVPASPDAAAEAADAAAAAQDAANVAADAATAAAIAAADEMTKLVQGMARVAIVTAPTTKSLNNAVAAAIDVLSPESIAINMSRAIIKSESMTESVGGTAGALSAARYTGQALRYAEMNAAMVAAATAPSESRGGSGGRFAMRYESNGGIIKPNYFAAGGTIPMPRRESAPTQKMNMGGMVAYMAKGGKFSPRGTDTVPAMLTPGEFVMSKYAVNSYGIDKMKAINNGTHEGEKVYNYNLSVNVKSDANPDDIARVVMTQIRQIDSQRIRTQRA